MTTETLYFIIGFLLGTLIMGCLSVVITVMIYEWFDRKPPNYDH